MSTSPLLTRYQSNISSPKQRGEGAHSYILSTANLARLANVKDQQVFDDLRQVLNKKVSDAEITQAITKANNGGTFTPRPRPQPFIRDGKAALRRIINQAKITTEVDLWEASPIRLWDDPQGDPVFFLETLYKPEDLLWIGEWHQTGIKTIMAVQDWIAFIRCGGKTAPHIIPNPMTGREGTTKTGKPSFRSDNTVKAYRFCVAEFDGLSREDQLKFWAAVKLPIVALIDSGGKSVHAWIDVQKLAQVETAEEWATHIKGRLYDQILTPMGVDSQCSNPSRLSRVPGHHREEKQAYQRLLWLSAEGRTIC